MKQRYYFEAATPFEQKILDWVFYPFSFIQPKQPRSLISYKFNNKANVLLIRIIFLCCSMGLLYFSIYLWKYYIPYIRYVINNPFIVVTPPTTHIGYGLEKWITFIICITTTGLALIMLRVKNLPIEFRWGMFCFWEGALGLIMEPLRYFGMTVSAPVWLGDRLFFVVLENIATFFCLLCAIRAEKWPWERLQAFAFRREESGEEGGV